MRYKIQNHMADTGIQVIARAVAILRFCKKNDRGLSLRNIAEHVHLPRSTVQRIVGALVAEGFLQSAGTARSIRLGQGIYELAEDAGGGVLEIAHPFLKSLSERTGETVDLSVFRRDHMLFIDQVSGSQRLRAISAVGDQFPILSAANGKASLAVLSPQELENVFEILRSQDKNLPGRNRFLQDIERIRKSGIAIDEEEHSPGICALGTAFKTVTGAVYAISIPMPSVRFSEKKVLFQALLLETRDHLLEALKR